MHKIDIEVPEGVLGLLRTIDKAVGAEFDVYLTGGFLRDSYGNAPIKDIDIMVIPKEAHENNTGEVMTRVVDAFIPDWFQPSQLLYADYLEGMSERGVDGLIMGFSPNLGNFETQLIVYGKPMSIQEVAEDMDLNICQIAMGVDGEVLATDAFVAGFQHQVITIMNGQSDSRERERVGRMMSKYPTFTATNPTVSDFSNKEWWE